MPKSKRKRRSQPDEARAAAATPLPWWRRRRVRRIGAIAVAVAAIAWLGFDWWRARSAAEEFERAATRGQPALAQVQRHPNEGRNHLPPGSGFVYRVEPPVSGDHTPHWLPPGFYDSPQPPELIVHALEHGNVVIYYDQLSDADRATLRGWVARFTGQWDAVTAIRRPGLGAGVILTAWTRTLPLSGFDRDAAAAFIDAYRGRGPEHPVR